MSFPWRDQKRQFEAAVKQHSTELFRFAYWKLRDHLAERGRGTIEPRGQGRDGSMAIVADSPERAESVLQLLL